MGNSGIYWMSGKTQWKKWKSRVEQWKSTVELVEKIVEKFSENKVQVTPKLIVLYTSNFIHIVFLKLSFGERFDNLDNQKNKLCLHCTVYSTCYTAYYKDPSFVFQKQ